MNASLGLQQKIILYGYILRKYRKKRILILLRLWGDIIPIQPTKTGQFGHNVVYFVMQWKLPYKALFFWETSDAYTHTHTHTHTHVELLLSTLDNGERVREVAREKQESKRKIVPAQRHKNDNSKIGQVLSMKKGKRGRETRFSCCTTFCTIILCL